MKALKIAQYIFISVGLGMLIVTFFIYKANSKFLETAITSQATIVDLLEVHSSSDNFYIYKPLVQFIDVEGKQVEFSSSSINNRSNYSVGDEVEVLYNPESSNDARINSYFSIWGSFAILGTLGSVFFIIGLSIFVNNRKGRDTLTYLKQSGTVIETDIQSVGVNSSYALNGINPYQIVSQWQNPATSKIHIFTSDIIWFDPSDYLKKDKIKVFIDINNPKKYWVDLFFLPEISE